MSRAEDQLDSGGGITDLVFDAEHPERRPWSFCNSRLPRSEVVYFTQIIIIIFLIIVSLTKLVFSVLTVKNPHFGFHFSLIQLDTLFQIQSYE